MQNFRSKNSTLLLLLLFILLSTGQAFAETLSDILVKGHRESFQFFPEEPALTEFEVRVEHRRAIYSFTLDSPSYYTKMVAKIETKKSEDLKKFAVVQYIRGCVFHTQKNDDGAIEYDQHTTRTFFEKKGHLFNHVNWVLDSTDRDPIYWSNTEEKFGDRFGLMVLNDPMHINTRDMKYMFRDYTGQNKMYVRDMPTGGSEFRGEFTNVSMEFKTCIYKTEDLPLVVKPSGEGILGKELKCVNWQNNFIYNFDKEDYEIHDQIDPYCLRTL